MFPLGYRVFYQGGWWVIDEAHNYGDLGILYCMHDPNLEPRIRCAWDKELKEYNPTPDEKQGWGGYVAP